MRSDMSKVLVERPRPASWKKFGDERHRKIFKDEPEDMITKESMRFRYGKRGTYDRKEFNENLSPLKRFLGANVGRLWNSIHSEMMQHINKDNPVQKHILTHINNFVIFNTFYGSDGKIWHLPMYGRGERLVTSSREEYYTCPKGFLRKNRVAARFRRVKFKPLMVERVGRKFIKLTINSQEMWFEVFLSPINNQSIDRYRSWAEVVDVIVGYIPKDRWGVPPSPKTLYGGDLYAKSKRQISSREVLQLKLEEAT